VFVGVQSRSWFYVTEPRLRRPVPLSAAAVCTRRIDCSHLGATGLIVDATAIDFSRSAFAVTATSNGHSDKHPSTRLK